MSALPKKVAAAAARADAVTLALTDPEADISWAEGLLLPDARKFLQERFERAYLERALYSARGNLSGAARKAGVDRSNLRRLLSRYDLRASDFSGE